MWPPFSSARSPPTARTASLFYTKSSAPTFQVREATLQPQKYQTEIASKSNFRY